MVLSGNVLFYVIRSLRLLLNSFGPFSGPKCEMTGYMSRYIPMISLIFINILFLYISLLKSPEKT